jgi:hypothetical protein
MMPVLEVAFRNYEESRDLIGKALNDVEAQINQNNFKDLTLHELIKIGEKSPARNMLPVIAERLKNIPDSVIELIELGYSVSYNQIESYIQQKIEEGQSLEMDEIEIASGKIQSREQKRVQRVEKRQEGELKRQLLIEQKEIKKRENEERRKAERKQKWIESRPARSEITQESVDKMLNANKLSLTDFYEEGLINYSLFRPMQRNGLETHDIRIYSHLTFDYFENPAILDSRGLGPAKAVIIEQILGFMNLKLADIKGDPIQIDSIITRATIPRQKSPDKENHIGMDEAFKIFNITGFVFRSDIVRNMENVISLLKASKELDKISYNKLLAYIQGIGDF